MAGLLKTTTENLSPKAALLDIRPSDREETNFILITIGRKYLPTHVTENCII